MEHRRTHWVSSYSLLMNILAQSNYLIRTWFSIILYTESLILRFIPSSSWQILPSWKGKKEEGQCRKEKWKGGREKEERKWEEKRGKERMIILTHWFRDLHASFPTRGAVWGRLWNLRKVDSSWRMSQRVDSEYS